ncbi:hypothetical protein MMC25_002398 [Agyrium rufum]|nr:hypothetical protein [Agyrium rufum]
MYIVTAAALPLLALETAASQPHYTIYKPTAKQAASPHVITTNTVNLERQLIKNSRTSFLSAFRKRQEVKGTSGTANLIAVENSQEFLVAVEFGKQTFKAILDTGSSDSWLAEKGFQCTDLDTGFVTSESTCMFGPLYSKSATFNQIPDLNFNISCGDGEAVAGIVGYEQVTLAGINVINQEIGVVDTAAWAGDETASGLIGLGFPSLTSAFKGTNPAADSPDTQVEYNPLFTNMITEGKVTPVFSLAISRGANGGTLAIGGVPNITHSPNFATSPFQILQVQPVGASPETQTQLSFYSITIQGFQIAGDYFGQPVGNPSANPSAMPDELVREQVIVDSGTTLLYLADSISGVANELFDPPAFYDFEQGAYVVDCQATPPSLGVDIDGQILFINPQDLIVDSSESYCISGIVDAGQGPGILGDVFLKNVLAVFDLGASEMRFAAREDY